MAQPGQQHYPDGDSKPDFWTPPEVYRQAMNLFNEGRDADLDAAASPENTLCERFFSLEKSAFENTWSAGTVWMNPPYSRSIMADFIERAWHQLKGHHCERVIMLLPARTCTQWFKKLVDRGASFCFITGRLNFGGPHTDEYQTSAPFPSVIVLLQRREHSSGGCAMWRDRP